MCDVMYTGSQETFFETDADTALRELLEDNHVCDSRFQIEKHTSTDQQRDGILLGMKTTEARFVTTKQMGRVTGRLTVTSHFLSRLSQARCFCPCKARSECPYHTE